MKKADDDALTARVDLLEQRVAQLEDDLMAHRLDDIEDQIANLGQKRRIKCRRRRRASK